MVYTISRGIDNHRERIQSYLFRGLPIAIATLIAVVGAFAPDTGDSNRQGNGQPLSIYTADSDGFGEATNPQGNGTDAQSSSSDEATADGSPDSSAPPSVQSSSGSTAAASTQTDGSTAQPEGGRGGGGETGGSGGSDEGDCLCEALPEAPLDVTTIEDLVEEEPTDPTDTLESTL